MVQKGVRTVVQMNHDGNRSYRHQEVDAFALEVDYPLKGEKLAYTDPILSHRFHIGSAYNTTTEIETVDLFDMIHTFTLLDWVCVGSVLAVFFSILRYGQKKIFGVQKPQAGWIVLTFFIDQDYLDEINLFLKIISITMSFFSFFVMQWFKNSMSTDLVTVTDPKSIQVYDDIIKYDAQPVWPRGHSEILDFSSAPEGTAGHQIWKHAVKRGDGSHLVSPVVEDVLNLIPLVTDQKVVMISKEVNVKIVGYFLCGLFRDDAGGFYLPDINLLNAVDPHASQVLSTLIHSLDMNQSSVAALEKQ